MLLGLDRVALSNGEEAMYKELYEALKSTTDKLIGKVGATGGFDDNILEAIGLQVFSKTHFSTIRLRKATTIAGECGFGADKSTITSVVLDECTGGSVFAYEFRNKSTPTTLTANKASSFGGYCFTGATGDITIYASVCKDFGTNTFQNCTGTINVYAQSVNKSETSGFPWGCTNATAVFHFKDGDYDYQGNPVAASSSNGGGV